jgi:predicted DNA-binding transcriptional regulator
MHKTDIDILYETVQKKGSMTIKEVQTQFKIDKKKADEWATILEENGLIKIRYSMFKGMILKKVE